METHYTWVVEGISKIPNTSKSPVFSGILGGRLLEWSIMLFPNGNGADHAEFVSVYLKLETPSIPETVVWFKLSLVDLFDNKLLLEQSGKPVNVQFPTEPPCGDYGWTKFMTRQTLFKKKHRLVLDGNTVRVHCCISNNAEMIHCTDQPSIAMSGENPYVGMWELYQQQKLVDFTITVGNKEFKVHKSLLAARSDVFAAMFEHDLMEKTSNSVVIEGIEPVVFEETIRFIYLNAVDHMDEFALDLLTCAERYQLKKLKVLCESWLSKTLSVATAADTLVVAHLNNAPFLKVRAVVLIANNLKEVMHTPGWKEVLRYGDLTNAVFKELADFLLTKTKRKKEDRPLPEKK